MSIMLSRLTALDCVFHAPSPRPHDDPLNRVTLPRSHPVSTDDTRGRRTSIAPFYGSAQTPRVEPLIGIALLASLVLIRRFAARRIAHGQGRFVWIYVAPMTLAMVFLVWIAVRMWTTQPLAGIGLALLIVPIVVLYLRAAKQSALVVGSRDVSGELSAPWFDYIVWTAVGAPLLLGVLLILLLIAGGLGTSR